MVNSVFHPSVVGKSSTSYLHGLNAEHIDLSRSSGVIAYGRCCSVALQWVHFLKHSVDLLLSHCIC